MTSPSYSRAHPNRIASEGGNYHRKSLRGNPTYHRNIARSMGGNPDEPPRERPSIFQTPNALCAGYGANANRPPAKQRVVSQLEVALMLRGRALACSGRLYRCERLQPSGLRWRCNGELLQIKHGNPQRCETCRKKGAPGK
jgi:hypothetical protein